VADNTIGFNIRHVDINYGSAAIRARNSKNLVIEGDQISGADLAAIDISADRTRTDLTSLNGPLIANNVVTGIRRNGVFADSRLGTKILGNTIRSVGTGIYAIAPSAWTSTQYAATPMFSAVRAYAALDLTVKNNSITDVGNIAIFGKRLPDQPVNKNGMTFTGNYISSSCVILDDCGAIYLSAPDRQSLNSVVSHNFIDGTRDKSKIGLISSGRPASSPGENNSAIYLDDSANGVAVSENTIVSTDFGVLIHNGFNNSIDKNRFWGNRQVNVYFSEYGGAPYSVNHNLITDNEFAQSQDKVIYQFATTNSRDPSYTRTFANYSKNGYFLSGGVMARGVADLSFGYDITQWRNAGFEDLTSSLFVQNPMRIYLAGNRSFVDVRMDCGAIAENSNSCAGYFYLHDRSPVAWPLHLPALSSYLLVR
jgi:parallel beta-helix repeat protein